MTRLQYGRVSLRRSGAAYGVGAAVVTVVFLAPLVLMVVGSLRQPGLPPPDGFDLVPDSVR